VIEEPHDELKTTSIGPRWVFFEIIEKLLPEETFCELGDTVKLLGWRAVATTILGVLMLTTTLPVAPPFLRIEMLVEER
jgi:hypothetical protein